MKRLSQFKGPLKPDEVAKGINAAIENAGALAQDARLLLEADRFARAAALAALSIEESGKVGILRALSLARSPEETKEEWKQYRRHTAKNVTWITEALFSKGARRLEDFREMFDPSSDHPQALDQIKQLGFYTDCLAGPCWSEPNQAIDAPLAADLVRIAETKASGRRVSTEEIELWIEVIGPVWKGPMEWMKKAVSDWHRMAVERGIVEGDPDTMERFVYGSEGDSA